MKFTLTLEIDLDGIDMAERDGLAWALTLIAQRLTTCDGEAMIADGRRRSDPATLGVGLWYEAMARAIASSAAREFEAMGYTDDPSMPDVAFLARARAWLNDNPWTDRDEQRVRQDEATARAEQLRAWAARAAGRGVGWAAEAAEREADLIDDVVYGNVVTDLLKNREAP